MRLLKRNDTLVPPSLRERRCNRLDIKLNVDAGTNVFFPDYPYISDDLIHVILSFLLPVDLCIGCSVSWEWKRLCMHTDLWQVMYKLQKMRYLKLYRHFDSLYDAPKELEKNLLLEERETHCVQSKLKWLMSESRGTITACPMLYRNSNFLVFPSFPEIPTNLIQRIFSFLGPRDLSRLSCVNYAWLERTMDLTVWKSVAARYSSELNRARIRLDSAYIISDALENNFNRMTTCMLAINKCIKRLEAKNSERIVYGTGDFFPDSGCSVPEHLMVYILSFLMPRDVCRCAQVCSQWNRISMDAILWGSLYLSQKMQVKLVQTEYEYLYDTPEYLELKLKRVERQARNTYLHWCNLMRIQGRKMPLTNSSQSSSRASSTESQYIDKNIIGAVPKYFTKLSLDLAMLSSHIDTRDRVSEGPSTVFCVSDNDSLASQTSWRNSTSSTDIESGGEGDNSGGMLKTVKRFWTTQRNRAISISERKNIRFRSSKGDCTTQT